MARRGSRLAPLESLLRDARHIRGEKGLSFAGGFTVSKCMLEFAQHHHVITYKTMRECLSKAKALQNLEDAFIQASEARLPFSPCNWRLLGISGLRGWDPPKLVPETHDPEKGLHSRITDIIGLIEADSDVQKAYTAFDDALLEYEAKISNVCAWIHEEFDNGGLEGKIERFLSREENKKTARLSKALVGALMRPEKSEAIEKPGEIPDLTVGEREAFQFLAWKLNEMTEREKHIRDWILDGRPEDPQTNGFLVVFEKNEALRKSFGTDIAFSGPHYTTLSKDLQSLFEKKRKILLEKRGETLELTLSLVQNIEMRHKFTNDTDYRDYIAVRIPFQLIRLHDKLYTSYPSDHFARLRLTPPKSQLSEPEVRFFDFVATEAPHKKGETKVVRRIKASFLEMVGGVSSVKNRNMSRCANKIETIFAPKAVNLGMLSKFWEDINNDGLPVYVFEYNSEGHAAVEQQ